MNRWERLGNDRPPEWLRPVKWLGIVLAIGAGCAYNTLFGAVSPRSDAMPTAIVTALVIPAATGLQTAAIEAPSAAPPVTPLAIGKVPPAFSLPLLGDTQTVSLAQFEGQPVLINFWASWCLPCREEMPALERAYRDHAPRGVVVLGINSSEQDTLEAATAFVSEFGVTYPQLWDATNHVLQDYGVMGLPMSVFINREGKIERLQYGVLTSTQLDEYLAELAP